MCQVNNATTKTRRKYQIKSNHELSTPDRHARKKTKKQ